MTCTCNNAFDPNFHSSDFEVSKGFWMTVLEEQEMELTTIKVITHINHCQSPELIYLNGVLESIM